jgi:hypothetical protein
VRQTGTTGKSRIAPMRILPVGQFNLIASSDARAKRLSVAIYGGP